jgi:hypothetical protein
MATLLLQGGSGQAAADGGAARAHVASGPQAVRVSAQEAVAHAALQYITPAHHRVHIPWYSHLLLCGWLSWCRSISCSSASRVQFAGLGTGLLAVLSASHPPAGEGDVQQPVHGQLLTCHSWLPCLQKRVRWARPVSTCSSHGSSTRAVPVTEQQSHTKLAAAAMQESAQLQCDSQQWMAGVD